MDTNGNLRVLLLKDLCSRLPYGVRGKVKADTVVPHKYDIDGFPLETTFDVDVELQRIDASNDEIFVSTFNNNEDLGNYIEEYQADIPYTIEEFTPYLRPMSSMTEEEKKEFESSGWRVDELDDNYPWVHIGQIENVLLGLNWLNAHHFDYCGLIEKGLAIEALERMYNI